MRKFSVFLLLANIFVVFYLHGRPDDNLPAQIALIHSEKIELLPAKVACLKWENLIGPVVQHVRVEISKWESGQDHITEISRGEVTVHWVHVPPLRNARETAKQIEQLKKSGISYLYIQENADSPWHNAISLAILPDDSDAAALVEELKGRGVERITDSEQVLEQFEFDIRNPTEQITESVRQLAQQFPETKLEATECSRL